MSTVLEQDEDLRRKPIGYAGGTNPGVAEDPLPLERTGIGTSALSSLASWEQLGVVLGYTRWLNIASHWFYLGSGSNYSVVPTTAEARSERPHEEALSLGPCLEDQIALIRSSLSLQVKELAQAVAVERPTVYSWINAERTPQPANRERLHTLYRLAQYWNRLSDLPLGKALHELDPDGRTIFDYLRDDRIPVPVLRERLRAASESAALSAAPPATSVRALAKKHGIDLRRIKERNDELDLETGKRIFPQ